MKRLHLPALLTVLALSGISLRAQAPAPGAPAAPAAPAATSAAGTPAPAAGAAATAKPYSTGDVQKVKAFAETLQFNLYIGEQLKWHGKADKELLTLGTRMHKEATDYWTPLLGMAQAHGVKDKDIPSAVAASDKANFGKVMAAKEDKKKLELYEFLSKEGKKNARSVDAAAKMTTDTELKDFITKGAKMIGDQADAFEKVYKDLKNPKKEVKK